MIVVIRWVCKGDSCLYHRELWITGSYETCETNNIWHDNLQLLSHEKTRVIMKLKKRSQQTKKMHTKSSSSWLSPLSRFTRRILFSSSSWAHRSFANARSALTVFNSRRSSFALAAIAIATCNGNQMAKNASKTFISSDK